MQPSLMPLKTALIPSIQVSTTPDAVGSYNATICSCHCICITFAITDECRAHS